MGAKYEIKTLIQGLSGNSANYYEDPVDDVTFAPPQAPSYLVADAQLSEHLNEGWKILNLTVIENFSFDGSEGGAYPQRIVTLKRKLPSPKQLYVAATQELATRIRAAHPYESGMSVNDDALAVYAREKISGPFGADGLLVNVEGELKALTPEMREAYDAAKAAQRAYQNEGVTA